MKNYKIKYSLPHSDYYSNGVDFPKLEDKAENFFWYARYYEGEIIVWRDSRITDKFRRNHKRFLQGKKELPFTEREKTLFRVLNDGDILYFGGDRFEEYIDGYRFYQYDRATQKIYLINNKEISFYADERTDNFYILTKKDKKNLIEEIRG